MNSTVRVNLLVLLFAGVIATVGYGFEPFMASVTPDPIAFQNVPFPILNPRPIHQGDVLRIQATRCTNEDHPIVATRTRALQSVTPDGDKTGMRRVLLPMDSSVSDPGCVTSVGTSTVITDDITPGYWRLEGVSQATGRWKSVTVPWQTEVFEVVED